MFCKSNFSSLTCASCPLSITAFFARALRAKCLCFPRSAASCFALRVPWSRRNAQSDIHHARYITVRLLRRYCADGQRKASSKEGRIDVRISGVPPAVLHMEHCRLVITRKKMVARDYGSLSTALHYVSTGLRCHATAVTTELPACPSSFYHGTVIRWRRLPSDKNKPNESNVKSENPASPPPPPLVHA